MLNDFLSLSKAALIPKTLKIAAGAETHLPQTTATYRPDIDGLRAIAVLAVLLFHSFPTLIPGGFVGVDMFFVISGYLISGHIIENLAHKNFSYLRFYSRRIRRIFPVLLIVLTTCLIVGFACLFSNELALLGKDIFASSLFSANILYWRESGYFDQPAETRILLHLWSLGIEEQFYIVWPVALAFFNKRTHLIFWITLFLLIASFTANVSFVHQHPSSTFYLPTARFWELFAGALLAYITLHSGKINSLFPFWFKDTFSPIKSACGFLLIGCAFFFIDRNMSFPGWPALLPVAGTFMVISAGPATNMNKVFLSHSLLVYIGLISYPLYLWHWPIIVFSHILQGGQPSIPVLLFDLLLSALLAIASYECLECSLRVRVQASKSFAKQTVIYCLLFMTILGGAGLATYSYSNTLPFRFRDANFKLDSKPGVPLSPACKRAYPSTKEFCAFSSETELPTVALLGDSHAMHYYEALKTYFKNKNENIFMGGAGSCPPLYDVDLEISKRFVDCPNVFNPLLDSVSQSNVIHTVILSSYAISTVTGEYFGDKKNYIKMYDLQNPKETSGNKIYINGLVRTVKKLLDAKKTVVILLDAPELDFEPVSCLVSRPFHFGNPHDPCAVELPLVNARLKELRANIFAAMASFPEVLILDPLPYMCDEHFCFAQRGDTFFYKDKNHLRDEGTDYLVSRFKTSLDLRLANH